MAFPSTAAATTTSFGTSVTAMPVNLPGSLASGDLLLAFSSVRNAGTWTLPSGWAEIDSQSSGGVGELTMFAKVSDGSEGASDDWTASVATTAVWHTFKVTGWFGSIPGTAADWVAKSTNGGGAASLTNPPSLIPAWQGDILWFAIGQLSAESHSYTGAPTNFSQFTGTNASSGGSGVAIGTATWQVTASGVNPDSFTNSANARWWDAMTVAVRPAASSGVSHKHLLTLGVG